MEVSLRPQKAFLLAAGLGTRLKSLTRQTPKCLLPVGGKPLLHWWLKALEMLGVEEALINTHHLAAQVEEFARKARYSVQLRLSNEPELLGSAGTVASNRDFTGDKDFWIIYADTLVAADLMPLLLLHNERRPPLTMGLFRPPDPHACGIVELSEDGRIVSFEEKPSSPRSDLACAGVFLAAPALWEHLPTSRGDMGLDVVPRLVGQAFGRILEGPVIDIGTPQAYALAQKQWSRLSLWRCFGVEG